MTSRLKNMLLPSLFILGIGCNSAFAETKWYFGLGVGQGEAEVRGHDRSDLILASLSQNGLTISAASGGQIDDTDSWHLLAGYQLSPHWSFELDYSDLGETHGLFTATNTNNGSTTLSGTSTSEYQNGSASLVATWHLTKQVFLLGRAGGHLWRHEFKLAGPGVKTSDKDSGSGLLYGAGLGYQQTHWSVRLEWIRFDNIEDRDGIDVKQLTVIYKLPSR